MSIKISLAEENSHPPAGGAEKVHPLVIVPTYNESRNIAAIIESVMALPIPFTMLVVDDNSADGTADIVKKYQQKYPDTLHLLERPGKMGLGTAYLAGFKYALDRNFTHICEMDADFSHSPEDLPRLVQAVSGGADIAVGSRYVDGVRVINWPMSRLILSTSAGVYARFITRLKIRDVTAGFKCFHRRVLENLPLDRVKSNGYSFQIEMNYRAFRKGYKIAEVPIVFTERSEGQSKMSNAIVREAAWKVWELRFRAIFGQL